MRFAVPMSMDMTMAPMRTRTMGMRMRMLAAMPGSPVLLRLFGAAQKRLAATLGFKLVVRLEKTVAYVSCGFIVEELDDDKRDVKEDRHIEVCKKLKRDPQRRPQHEEKERVYTLAVDNLSLLRPLIRPNSRDDKADQHTRFPPTEGVNRVSESRPFKVADIHRFEFDATVAASRKFQTHVGGV